MKKIFGNGNLFGGLGRLQRWGGAAASPLEPRAYFDHAGATPMHSAVREAMFAYEEVLHGNASAIHTEGRKSKEVLRTVRQEVATLLGLKPDGVIFTSSGTESNNLAILGLLKARYEAGTPYEEMEVITLKTEHSSIIKPLAYLESFGVKTHYLPVEESGIVSDKTLKAALSKKTVLVTITYVNSEVGTVQPLRRLARVLRNYQQENNTRIIFHTDAAQAPFWQPVILSQLDVDLMSLDTRKFGGPKGLGILVWQKGVTIAPLMYGGGQESGLRPGTEDVSGALGAALALRLATEGREERVERVAKMRDYLLSELLAAKPDLLVNGSLKTEERVANNINISLPGIDTEYATVVFDTHGVAVGTKSACSGADGGESKVVKALYSDSLRACATLRITLGPETTKDECDRLVGVFREKVLTLHESDLV